MSNMQEIPLQSRYGCQIQVLQQAGWYRSEQYWNCEMGSLQPHPMRKLMRRVSRLLGSSSRG